MKTILQMFLGLLIFFVGFMYALYNYDHILYEKYKLAVEIAEHSNESEYLMSGYVKHERKVFLWNFMESLVAFVVSFIVMCVMWSKAFKNGRLAIDEEASQDENAEETI